MTVSTASALPRALPQLDWITDPRRVARLSQDFAWFSPVLKRDLAGKRGDIAVRPRTEAEIRQVVAACASAGIPSPCAAAAPATTARARHCMAA